MTLKMGLHIFFLEMSKKCWPRFRVRNSTPAKLPCRRVAEGLLFYNIFYTGNGRTDAPQKTGKFVGLR
jgi:hypothetical protein